MFSTAACAEEAVALLHQRFWSERQPSAKTAKRRVISREVHTAQATPPWFGHCGGQSWS